MITAGGTEEPIDGVRRLTNLSTGATGAVLARRLAAHGAEVVLLSAARSVTGDGEFQREAFATFDELEAVMKAADWDFVQLNYSILTPDAEQRLLPLADVRRLRGILRLAHHDWPFPSRHLTCGDVRPRPQLRASLLLGRCNGTLDLQGRKG